MKIATVLRNPTGDQSPQLPLSKYLYSITEYGQRMTPLLQAMNDWGEDHMDHLKELYGEDPAAELPERS
ncbi:winged helix-turn-helix transcriptional regulator [Paenibacillus taichungensis]|uniref:winged helix-turn-helix transcriptional regulator n=1 Tax=Paenibacillus taichungensis TaxID=484184 RepID=UPI0038D21189